MEEELILEDVSGLATTRTSSNLILTTKTQVRIIYSFPLSYFEYILKHCLYLNWLAVNLGYWKFSKGIKVLDQRLYVHVTNISYRGNNISC